MASGAKTDYKHVVLDERGAPIIQGTSMKVLELVVEHLAYGWSPEELHFQHPYLTLGQIHAALAYYWDHVEEMDREITKRLREVERLQEQVQEGQSHLAARLRSRGLR